MNKQEFVMFTSLISFLKEYGINFTEFLSRDEVKRYTEIAEKYVSISDEEFRDELKNMIEEQAKRLLS
ncbi:hypothetical protein ABEX47_20495 [Paenibacillus ehimensis]|uniref:hypothetical protein n=1 Tax=Paenibacillus ehimensis TaxID=79264 RepID=UPI000FDBBDB0|nr:hypothetical protein [Paenibacillus ehimensis]MEC0208431.1 hypothetical protein [Paenibacillus ehimensis]